MVKTIFFRGLLRCFAICANEMGMDTNRFSEIKRQLLSVGPSAGLSQTSIYRILQGERQPSLAVLARLMETTDIKITDILALRPFRKIYPDMPDDRRREKRRESASPPLRPFPDTPAEGASDGTPSLDCPLP